MALTAQSLLVSFDEASTLLGISRALLYQMHSDGRLGPLPHKLGRRTLLSRRELEAWVEAGLPPRIQWLSQAKDKPSNKSGFSQHKQSKPADWSSAAEIESSDG